MGEGPHGHRRNEVANVLAKNAAEGVPPDDHDRWMSGGGIRQWTKQRKRDYLEEGGNAVSGRAMGWRRKAVTNYCRLRGGNAGAYSVSVWEFKEGERRKGKEGVGEKGRNEMKKCVRMEE